MALRILCDEISKISALNLSTQEANARPYPSRRPPVPVLNLLRFGAYRLLPEDFRRCLIATSQEDIHRIFNTFFASARLRTKPILYPERQNCLVIQRSFRDAPQYIEEFFLFAKFRTELIRDDILLSCRAILTTKDLLISFSEEANTSRTPET
ncbi:MAG: hypothetical protein CL912_15255 [Deltaproteobacteria bacterium]|nr:hypothetical protein [Deltaproteobacteria bacterium]